MASWFSRVTPCVARRPFCSPFVPCLTLLRVSSALLGAFLCLLSGSVSAASLSEALTTELNTLTQTLQPQSAQTPSTLSAQTIPTAELLATASARHDLLSTLMLTHPAEVLRVALPASVRAGLPPTAQVSVEQHVELEGELEVQYEDWEQRSHLRYILKMGDEELALHFATKPPTALRTGARIRVTGVQIGQAVALAGRSSVQTLSAPFSPATTAARTDGSSTHSQTQASALSPTSRELHTLVMRVNFQDYPTVQPHSLALVQAAMSQANDFFLENSQQQVSLTSDVVGYYTLPLNSSPCNPSQMATLAKQAATAAGVNLAAYSNYLYVFSTGSCGWGGLATLNGNQAWLNGIDSRLITHEMGHNLGLHHSHQLNCGYSTFDPPCTTVDYGDYLDVMGHSVGHYNAFQKERLNWLPGLITTVQSSGTYLLDPYETPAGANPKALKILKTSGTWYYLEYRQPIGFDSFVQASPNVRNGLVVHMGSGSHSSLLTMMPETHLLGSALEVGHTFTDPTTGLTITTLWANTTGAAVTVSFAPPPTACLSLPPTVTFASAPSPGVPAGTAVSYTVAMTNNESAACPATHFTWQASLPASSWTATFAAPTLTLAPGAHATTTLQVTSPAAAFDGFYTVGAQATASAPATASAAPAPQAAAASTIYQIASGLTVSVATAQPSYRLRQQVAVQASVQRAGAPVAGATVAFTITRPNGTVLKKTNLHSKTQGTVAVTFTLNGQYDSVGVYQIAVHVSMKAGTGEQVGDSATSFLVQ